MDHMIVFGGIYLGRILKAIGAFFNAAMTYRFLGRDTAIQRQIQHLDSIASRPMLGGLHYGYVRI